MTTRTKLIGASVDRIEGEEKVRGLAAYTAEHPVGGPLYLAPIQSRVARGRVTGLDVERALNEPGVVVVLNRHNALRVASGEDAELAVLQSPEVHFRGQLIGGVVASTPEAAQHAAHLVDVEYQVEEHDVDLHSARNDLVKPDRLNGGHATDTAEGDVEAALLTSATTIEHTYTTPQEHNNPLEPHATIAWWEGDELTLYDSTQGVHWVRDGLARVLGLDTEQIHVISPHVGGGFGSKGATHANVVLTAMAARLVAPRPVKMVLTREQMFSVVGYRTGTIQHVRLGADSTGRLTAISFDVVEQTSRIKEFAEQTGVPSRTMYAAPNRRTTHRVAPLDVPVPSWMRAPGECPGMFGLEVAMDEMAIACGLDPVEFRVRNEPERDPDTKKPFSSRHLVECLREGARRFGWAERNPRPRAQRSGDWWVGTGVAASTYPVTGGPGTSAIIRAQPDGRYRVLIGAADIGTGTWTALTQIAADALGVDLEDVQLSIGDTDLPWASGAGGSSGITCWGSAIVDAARKLREELPPGAEIPMEGVEVTGKFPKNPHKAQYAMRSFGAQFAEVAVHAHTGEVRVPRMLGIFAVGQVVNAKTARSQLIGGMTMGISMALHEQSVVDRRFGHVVNHDLAEYHIPTHADIGQLEVDWIEESDPYVNPMGTKGIGELGIVGTAAAISNAAYHATGIRVRELPLTLDKFLQW